MPRQADPSRYCWIPAGLCTWRGLQPRQPSASSLQPYVLRRKAELELIETRQIHRPSNAKASAVLQDYSTAKAKAKRASCLSTASRYRFLCSSLACPSAYLLRLEPRRACLATKRVQSGCRRQEQRDSFSETRVESPKSAQGQVHQPRFSAYS